MIRNQCIKKRKDYQDFLPDMEDIHCFDKVGYAVGKKTHLKKGIKRNRYYHIGSEEKTNLIA